MEAPDPGPGEVRVRVALSGVNPGDAKKRGDWLGYGMPFPRIVPHSDGAGVVERVGEGVDSARVGERVWLYGAQSYRAFGTAAQFTVVPAEQAVALPSGVSDEVGACLGIPGLTAHRALFADGPVAGKTILVHGSLGGVGSMAAQVARRGGATVIGTVTRESDVARVDPAVAHAVSLDQEHAGEAIRARARPAAWTASSRLPCPTTPTWTPRSSRLTASSPPMRAGTTGPRSRSGRCSSRT
jgi:NADPH2:quinone reductase